MIDRENEKLVGGSRRAEADSHDREEEAPKAIAPKESMMSSQKYKQAISYHSKNATDQSLYPGYIFSNLAKFFQLSNCPPPSKLKPKYDAATTLLIFKESGKQSMSAYNPNDLEIQLKDAKKASNPHILFLNGYQSGETLANVGSIYRIDPEFYRRHQNHGGDYFSLPSLPSAADNIIRLRFVTIGERTTERVESNQGVVDRLRTVAKEMMVLYQDNYLTRSGFKSGQSVVRKYYVHDETHFSIEQEMTICVRKIEGTWFTLVWLDAGEQLSNSPLGPWNSSPDQGFTTMLYPTVHHTPNISLSCEGCQTSVEHGGSENNMSQNICSMREQYGRMLNLSVIRMDAFYCLRDLFLFSASSEVQFLNMIESKIGPEIGHNMLIRQMSTLSNLLYTKEILEDHIERLQETILVIKRRGGSKWPQAHDTSLRGEAEESADQLLDDFEYLLERAMTLSSRCEKGMVVIMNNAALAESKKAIEQAEGVAKLTRLAFFYIPLSFTASFFGMNFNELGGHSIWIWFAVSVPIFMMSIVFLIWDIPSMVTRSKQNLYTWCRGVL